MSAIQQASASPCSHLKATKGGKIVCKTEVSSSNEQQATIEQQNVNGEGSSVTQSNEASISQDATSIAALRLSLSLP